jgi:4-hydroxy-3-polyprenylbenzoate decarboxylase
MKPYIVAMTGASGVVYGVRLLEVLAQQKVPIELVISATAKIVMKEERNDGFFDSVILRAKPEESRAEILRPFRAQDDAGELIRLHHFHDFTAPIASGSYPTEGMVIIPCSMGTLGAIASGLSQNLIHRAADCAIKEGRKLILVPRETPLSAIHLENMLKLARLGVKIVPPMPAFYGAQQTVSDLVDFVVGKVLDQMGIPHMLYPRWVGKT